MLCKHALQEALLSCTACLPVQSLCRWYLGLHLDPRQRWITSWQSHRTRRHAHQHASHMQSQTAVGYCHGCRLSMPDDDARHAKGQNMSDPPSASTPAYWLLHDHMMQVSAGPGTRQTGIFQAETRQACSSPETLMLRRCALQALHAVISLQQACRTTGCKRACSACSWTRQPRCPQPHSEGNPQNSSVRV